MPEAPTFRIVTLGCKVNAYESEQYAEDLQKQGFLPARGEEADVYVVNTCAVTSVAAAKCRQRVHALRRDHPHALIAAVGCYVQISRNDPEVLSDCDLLFGTFEKGILAEKVAESFRTGKKGAYISDRRQGRMEPPSIESFYQTRAYLKVQDGCDQFCSYCIIPYARGRERSLPLKDALDCAKRIVGPAHQELVLTGIHTGRWRDGDRRLEDLADALLGQVPDLKRLRLSSIEMNEVTDGLVALMKRDRRFARHLHIPLQAASDPILRAMNRPYTVQEYAERIEWIRREIPGISISCDVIAGFPGETDALFEEGMQNLRRIRPSFLHVFPFSAREGTPAARMSGQVDPRIRRQRVTKLTELSRGLYNTYAVSHRGDILEIYVEEKQGGWWLGHSSEYLPVSIRCSSDLTGRFVKAVLQGREDGRLVGKRVKE